MSKLIITLSLAVMAAMVVTGLYIHKTTKDSNTVKPNFTQFQETHTKISQPEQQNHTVFVGAGKLKPSKQTISGEFAEANKNFFEQVTGYMGYDTDKKESIEVKFRPDISSSAVVYGNGGSDANWGYACTSAHTCAPSITSCPTTDSYLGVNYAGAGTSCFPGATYISFKKDQDPKDMTTTLDVQFTSLKNTTWPFDQTALLGMGPKSKYLEWVLEAYDFGEDGYEFSFFYDILLKANRFDADKAKAFDITLTNFGQNKGNLQDSDKLQIVTMSNTATAWTLPVTKIVIDDSSAPVIVNAATDAVLVNAGNEYFAMGSA